jgi:hypothetical protein
LILLWAYANHTAKSLDYDFCDADMKHGVIKGEVATLVFQAGASGKPLDLSLLSQNQ